MNKNWFHTDTFKLELKLLEEIYISDNIHNFLFYKWDKIDDYEFEKSLNNNGIYIYNYVNRGDIIEKVRNINTKNNVLYIHTTIETTMNITNELKTLIWQTSPENHKIFRDKFIQRELVSKHNPDLGIKYISGTFDKLDFSDISSKTGVPFILKPTTGVQSTWVVKINSRLEFENYTKHFTNYNTILSGKGIDGHTLIAEEFIDGNLYSIDYFVSKTWKIVVSEPIKEKLWIDIWIDDYFVLSRITTKEVQNTFRYIRLDKFIKDTVVAMKIKNSFIHHEFKINSHWQLKTIEVNGRIGWWRHELMYKAFGINFFRFILDEKQRFCEIQENVIWINVLSTKNGILEWFNTKLFQEIEELASVYEVIIQKNHIWKKCWLTKDGFSRVWTIKLSNIDEIQLNKDYSFIEKNYKNLLKISEN
jgi:hypothetical protein